MLQISGNFAGVPFTMIVKDDGTELKIKGFTESEFDQALTVTNAPSVTEPQLPANPTISTDTPAPANIGSNPSPVAGSVTPTVTTPSPIEPPYSAPVSPP